MPFASRAIAHGPTGGGVALSSMPPFSSLLSIPLCFSPRSYRYLSRDRDGPPPPPLPTLGFFRGRVTTIEAQGHRRTRACDRRRQQRWCDTRRRGEAGGGTNVKERGGRTTEAKERSMEGREGGRDGPAADHQGLGKDAPKRAWKSANASCGVLTCEITRGSTCVRVGEAHEEGRNRGEVWHEVWCVPP